VVRQWAKVVDKKEINMKKRCFRVASYKNFALVIGILLVAGVLFATLLLNSTVAAGAGSSSTPKYSSAVTASVHTQTSPIMNDKRQEARRRLWIEQQAAQQAMTSAQRQAAAIRIAALNPNGMPDYFGTIPNFANSQLPTVDANGNISGGIMKFVDSLPGLGPGGANDIGQYIPIAVPDTTTFPNSDYYEIALVEYSEKMHSNLSNTTLRGYVQLETSTVSGAHIPLKYPNGVNITYPGGQIASINVTNGGAGYVSPPAVQISGSGTGANAQAVLATGWGSVSSVTITNGGSGYTSAPLVNITGGSGSGANATAIINVGRVIGVTILTGGANYTNPVVNFTGGGGTGAAATAFVTFGRVIGITILTKGAYYTNPVVTFTGGGGSGAAATAILTGSVTSVTVTNGGRLYTSAPIVNFSGGGGSGAAATAFVSYGRVVGVKVTNRGTNYSSEPVVSFIGGGGNSATATATIAP
jgi:hypothetical protein